VVKVLVLFGVLTVVLGLMAKALAVAALIVIVVLAIRLA
jgi:hypothetical protein